MRVRVALALALASPALLAGCHISVGSDAVRVVSDNGVGVLFDSDGELRFLQFDDRAMPAKAVEMAGFYLRGPGDPLDRRVALSGSVRKPGPGRVDLTVNEQGLALNARVTSQRRFLLFEAEVRNQRPGPRAVVVGFNLPIDATGWTYGRSIMAADTIQGVGTFAEWTSADSDWDGRQVNRGLFSCIHRELSGLAMGVEPDQPQVFRVFYRRDLGLTIEFDLGLGDLPRRFKQSAPLRFILFRFDPREGYRSALARYYEMFKAQYAGGVKAASGPPAEVYLASQPMPIPAAGGANEGEADRIRRQLALLIASDPGNVSIQTSQLGGPDGLPLRWTLRERTDATTSTQPDSLPVHYTPLDPDPELAVPNQATHVLRAVGGRDVHLLGLDDYHGRYLDNYRAAHLAVVDFAPAFDYRLNRPVQVGLTRSLELLRPLAEGLAARGRSLVADVRPWRASVLFDARWLDGVTLSGVTPRDASGLGYLRSLMGAKPIVQDRLPGYTGPPDLVAEQHRIDALLLMSYGVMPAAEAGEMFDAARDAARQLIEAGWQPITYAKSSHPDILVERFGPLDADVIFYTVYNRSSALIDYHLNIDAKPMSLMPSRMAVFETLNNRALTGRLNTDGTVTLAGRLLGGAAHVIELRASPLKPFEAIEKLPEATPRPKGVTPAAAGYDGPGVTARRDQLGLAGRERSWANYLACYEAEKTFVVANVKRLFGHLSPAHAEWSRDEKGFMAAMRLLIDFSVRAYQSQFRSVLNGPQFERLAAARRSGRLGDYQFRAKLVSAPGGPSLELVAWDPVLESGDRISLSW